MAYNTKHRAEGFVYLTRHQRASAIEGDGIERRARGKDGTSIGPGVRLRQKLSVRYAEDIMIKL